MASNEPLLMERLLRQTILTRGQLFLSHMKLNTEALLVITIDEDTRTRSVVDVSDVIMNKSSVNNSVETNQSRSDKLKMVLEDSMKSTLLENIKSDNSINLIGIVTYQVDDGTYYVIKLDFEIKRHKGNRQGNGSSSSISMINYKNEDKLDQMKSGARNSDSDDDLEVVFDTSDSEDDTNIAEINLIDQIDAYISEELGMQHEDDVSQNSSGARDVSGSDMAKHNVVNNDSLRCFNEDFYKNLGLKVNENKDITCRKCYKQCDDIKLLQVHNSLMHEGFTCLVCGKMLANKHTLKQHTIVAHTPGNKECVFCKKTFHYDSDLKKHIRLTHGNEITSNASQKRMTSQDMKKTRVSANRQQMQLNISMKSSIKQNVTKSHKQKLPNKLTSLPSNKKHTGQKRRLVESSRVSLQSMHSESSTEICIPKKKKIVHQSHKPPSKVTPSAPKKKKIVQLQNNDHDVNMKKNVVNQSSSSSRSATQTYSSSIDVNVDNEVTRCGYCGMQFNQRDLMQHLRENPHHIS